MITPAPEHRPPEAVLELIEAADGPALAVDLASAYIVAANAAARARLGRADAALDAAMPSVPALREMREADGAEPPGAPARLTFWTARGAECWPCRVRLVPCASGGPIAVLHLEPEALDGGGEALDTSATAAGRSGAGGDDLATLARIASRIREAQAMRQAKPDAPTGKPPAADAAECAAAGAPVVVPDPEADPDAGSSGAATTAQRRAADHEEAASASAPAPAAAEPGRSPRSRLAHELKTPLGAIAAAAELIRDERLGPIANTRYRDYAADIAESAHHALAVINRMLEEGEASAAGSGHRVAGQAMTFAEIDVNDVARRCTSAMRLLAEEAGLELATRLDERLPHVIADATALRQIVLNLLTNAVKFTAAGGAITVETRHTDDGRVAVSVADTGRGIAPGDTAVPAEPSGPRRREGGGYGIGLPLVRALAEANGASVSFASAPGRGTAVTVAFAPDRVIPV